MTEQEIIESKSALLADLRQHPDGIPLTPQNVFRRHRLGEGREAVIFRDGWLSAHPRLVALARLLARCTIRRLPRFG
jgi:hypothetical protein